MPEKISLENGKSKDLKKIINNIKVSEKKTKILSKRNKKNIQLEKKPKKLPSLNLMKTKTIRFIKEKRNILLKEIKKNKNQYFFVIENISKMRDETRLFKSLTNKKPNNVKDLYFKYFGHLHGLNKKNLEKK